MITAIILAGGVGSRAGADRPKQFVEVLGRPVVAYTIEIFEAHPEVDAIEVVCHRAWNDYLREVIKKYGYKKVKWITDGGETFQASVINGLEYLRTALTVEDYVLIQYGAAPFTSERIVTDVIRVMRERGSAVTGTPCYQLLGSRQGDVSRRWINRDACVQLACPQGFRYGYVLDIYERARAQGLLERTEPHTTSLMYALGDEIYLSYGDQTNLKITTQEDFELFEGYMWLKRREK